MQSTDRAQSELIGVVLLVGVVVVLVSMISVVMLGQVDTNRKPVADLRIRANDTTLTIEHAGGDAFAVDDLRVTVNGETDHKQFPVDAANVSGSDGTFDFGDRFVRKHGLSDASVTVMVVYTPSNTILAEDRLDL
ncbi:MAG: type IV pilin N-terminal domain-containing protein [Halorientalis sp.]